MPFDDLFRPSRAEQIFDRFVEFHRQNPEVWRLFERFALQAAAAGRSRYGAAAIVERVRWHIEVETKGDAVKINNDFRAYYARMFMVAHPGLDLFEIRRRVSADKPAYDVDLSFVPAAPLHDERTLMEQLRRLLPATRSHASDSARM